MCLRSGHPYRLYRPVFHGTRLFHVSGSICFSNPDKILQCAVFNCPACRRSRGRTAESGNRRPDPAGEDERGLFCHCNAWIRGSGADYNEQYIAPVFWRCKGDVRHHAVYNPSMGSGPCVGCNHTDHQLCQVPARQDCAGNQGPSGCI